MNVQVAENDFMNEMICVRIVFVDLCRGGRRSRKRRGPSRASSFASYIYLHVFRLFLKDDSDIGSIQCPCRNPLLKMREIESCNCIGGSGTRSRASYCFVAKTNVCIHERQSFFAEWF
jgi:hypothetical protein